MRGIHPPEATAGLCRLELLPFRNAAADIFNDFAKSCAHRDLNKTGVMYFAAEREYLGTFDFSVPMEANHFGTL